jgi:hypothetical protein
MAREVLTLAAEQAARAFPVWLWWSGKNDDTKLLHGQ